MPVAIRKIALVVSAAVLLSALVAATLALVGPVLTTQASMSWVLAGFEAVTAVAAVIGVLFGLGRYAEAPAIALASVALTVLVASTLGWMGSGRTLLGVSLTPLLAARAMAAAVLGVCAAACVLGRQSGAWRLAAIGGALALPGLMVGGIYATGRGHGLIDVVLGAGSTQRLIVGTLGALALGIMLAVGAHLVVTAFEMGRRGGPTSSPSA